MLGVEKLRLVALFDVHCSANIHFHGKYFWKESAENCNKINVPLPDAIFSRFRFVLKMHMLLISSGNIKQFFNQT